MEAGWMQVGTVLRNALFLPGFQTSGNALPSASADVHPFFSQLAANPMFDGTSWQPPT